MDLNEAIKLLFDGFGVTVLIFAITLVVALPLGLILAFGLNSKFKPLRYLLEVFVWIIRGTPLMLQVIIFYYGPGLLFQFNYPTFKIGTLYVSEGLIAVLIAFIINYAAYFSVIYKGGINSINKGQFEAGQVLGMTRTQIFFKVILLQLFKNILAPMSNEIITLVKDTSLARIVTVAESIFVAGEIMIKTGVMWPIFLTGVYYLVFVGLLTLLFNWLEKRLSYFN